MTCRRASQSGHKGRSRLKAFCILGELNANPNTKATALPPELHVLPTDTLAEANAKYNAAKAIGLVLPLINSISRLV